MSSAPPLRRFQPQTRSAIRPLTPPVAPRFRPSSKASTESQARFHRPRVNASGFPGPRRLPSTSAPYTALAEHRSRGGSPPPCPGLCRRGPASDALSLFVMLSHRGARPLTVAMGCSPMIARTARRLPTSAIETNCEHNCLTVRAPHTTPESPPAQLCLRVAQTRLRAVPAEISQARGFCGDPHAASLCRDRSQRELYPNLIGSSTSCRKPVSAGSWSSLRRR